MPRATPAVSSWQHRAAKTEDTRARHALARDKLRELEESLQQEISDVAAEVGLKRDTLQAAFRAQRFEKKINGVSATNAARHLVARQYKDAHKRFNLTLPECHQDVLAKQEELQASPAALEDARHMILEYRSDKKQQVRRPGRSRQTDTLKLQDDLQREAANFNLRTGGHACGFMLRGSVKDYARPQWFGDEACHAFFEDVLKIPMEELVLALEAWVLSGGAHGTAERVHARVNQHKAAIRAMLDKSLRDITRQPDARMAYVRFSQDIEDRYQVTLDGWPLPGEITNPSNISGLMSLVTLRKALASGSCHFRAMTPAELETRDHERKKELEAKAAERAQKHADASENAKSRAARRKRPAPDQEVQASGDAPVDEQPSPPSLSSGSAKRARTEAHPSAQAGVSASCTAASTACQPASANAGRAPQVASHQPANDMLGTLSSVPQGSPWWNGPPSAPGAHFLGSIPGLMPMNQAQPSGWWAPPPQAAGVTMNNTYILMDGQRRGPLE